MYPVDSSIIVFKKHILFAVLDLVLVLALKLQFGNNCFKPRTNYNFLLIYPTIWHATSIHLHFAPWTESNLLITLLTPLHKLERVQAGTCSVKEQSTGDDKPRILISYETLTKYSVRLTQARNQDFIRECGNEAKVDQTTEMYFFCLIRLFRKVAKHEKL